MKELRRARRGLWASALMIVGLWFGISAYFYTKAFTAERAWSIGVIVGSILIIAGLLMVNVEKKQTNSR